jgi:hypothetical protein
MFVGHYGAALALNSAERRASLGLLFLGVQFVDILFFPLVAAGVERMSIVPNATASTHFTLDYMPYTHGLVASVAWSALAFVVFGLWNNAFLTFSLETVLLVGGLWLYMRSTQPKEGLLAKYGMPVFVVLLLLINVGNLFGPPPETFTGIFFFAMASYLGFAGLAFGLDRRRSRSGPRP